jgi:Redoxin
MTCACRTGISFGFIGQSRRAIRKRWLIRQRKKGSYYSSRHTVITYPEVTLNEPIPESVFQFVLQQKRIWSRSSRTTLIFPRSKMGARVQPPDVMLSSVDGHQVQLSSFRGHPVLINIGATWSAPCISGFRDLAHLYEEAHQTRLAILFDRPIGRCEDSPGSSAENGLQVA